MKNLVFLLTVSLWFGCKARNPMSQSKEDEGDFHRSEAPFIRVFPIENRSTLRLLACTNSGKIIFAEGRSAHSAATIDGLKIVDLKSGAKSDEVIAWKPTEQTQPSTYFISQSGNFLGGVTDAEENSVSLELYDVAKKTLINRTVDTKRTKSSKIIARGMFSQDETLLVLNEVRGYSYAFSTKDLTPAYESYFSNLKSGTIVAFANKDLSAEIRDGTQFVYDHRTQQRRSSNKYIKWQLDVEHLSSSLFSIGRRGNFIDAKFSIITPPSKYALLTMGASLKTISEQLIFAVSPENSISAQGYGNILTNSDYIAINIFGEHGGVTLADAISQNFEPLSDIGQKIENGITAQTCWNDRGFSWYAPGEIYFYDIPKALNISDKLSSIGDSWKDLTAVSIKQWLGAYYSYLLNPSFDAELKTNLNQKPLNTSSLNLAIDRLIGGEGLDSENYSTRSKAREKIEGFVNQLAINELPAAREYFQQKSTNASPEVKRTLRDIVMPRLQRGQRRFDMAQMVLDSRSQL